MAGRFIKNTTLLREQIFEKGKGLVKDHSSMRSSPSGLFLLILNNHRLVYVNETKFAPSKEAFRTTLLHFVREKHRVFINDEYERMKKAAEEEPGIRRVTKKELLEEIPKPTLELIPLTSEESIESFVRQYDILKIVEITLADRNDETDNSAFFEQFQKRKDAIGSKKSLVKHHNTKGLKKDEAIKEIKEATFQGNQTVKLSGLDIEGDILKGNNENFQLKKPLDSLSEFPGDAAHKLFESFMGLVKEGLIKVPQTSSKAFEILKTLKVR